jgi:hypothetical protein
MPKRIHRRRDADPREGLKKYGKATLADPVNNKPSNAEKHSDEDSGPSRFGFDGRHRHRHPLPVWSDRE